MLRRGIESDRPKGEKKQKYDTKCEVYSFGILLWEIAECKIAYQNFEDFVELTTKVIEGYRENFSPDTDIPEKYIELVTRAVDDERTNRPTLAYLLTDLQDIIRKEHHPSRSNTSETSYTSNTSKNSYTSNTSDTYKPRPSPESLMVFNWNPQTMTIDEAEKHHNDNTKDKKELYKCFDSYAMMGNPKGKYWKAYYITKGWSDLKCSQSEKDKIAAKLFKEAADYGDEIPDAQLRYATMVMQGKGVDQNVDVAIEYFLKAAKNDHVVAMFNVATYYFSHGKEELGKYYMIKAANKNYEQAISYCKKNKISY